MFEFNDPKRLLTNDQVMIMKLSIIDSSMIDYLANSYSDYSDPSKTFVRRSHEFLGFLEENTNRPFGFEFKDQRFVAVHVVEQNWDYKSGVQIDVITGEIIADEFWWFLIFQGTSSISYHKCFGSKSSLDHYWQNLDYLTDTADMFIKSSY